MKIILAQQNYHIGNFESNTQKILQGIADAEAQGADLVVFSEMCICGYPPRDFLEFNDFILECGKCIEEIAQHTDDIAVVLGSPRKNPVVEGKDLYNSAFFIHERIVKQIVDKTLLPTYDIFDE